jgi:hypothetical protein
MLQLPSVIELLESCRLLREESRLRRELLHSELVVLQKHVNGVLDLIDVKKQEHTPAAQSLQPQ